MGLLTRRWVRAVTTAAMATAVVSLVPLSAADAAVTTLPAGTSLTNTITSPVTGANVGSTGATTVTGSGAVGTTPSSGSNNQLIYVIDRSGSTSDAATGCPGGATADVNGDGRSNTVLDCELAAALALNVQAVNAGSVSKVGVVSFDTNSAVVQPLIAPSDPIVPTRIKSITVGGNTNFEAGVKSACTLAGTSNPTTVVFLSDGVANAGGNAVTAATGCGANVTIRTFAVGSGSSCTNTGGARGSLAQIAAAKGGTCTAVANLSSLPTVISAIADPKVSAVTGTIDGGSPVNIPTTPALPAGSVSYTWNVSGLSPGNHTLCTTVTGFDIGGSGSATECRTVTVAAVTRSVSVNDVTVNEGAGTATFTVTASPSAGAAGTVHFATSDGTATAPSDYTATSGTLSFGAGDVTKTITVPIIDDNVFEGTENFNVTLSAPTGLTIGDGSGVGTITDNEGKPTVSITGTPGTPGQTGTPGSPDVSITEGNGPVCTTAALDVKLSGPSSTPVTVTYGTGGGTATAGTDYTTTTGTVTFAPGETSKMVTICVIGDIVDEPNETFNVTASSTGNGTATSVVTIVDDDATPTLAITGGDTTGNGGSVNEGNTGTTCKTVTVTLSNPSSSTVTAQYATSNGTASASDYVAASGTVTFAPGVLSQTFPVCAVGDLIDESNETFNVTLSAPTNAVLPSGSAATSVITIIDDDDAVTLSVNDVTVTEGNAGTTPATFTVTRSRASGEAISVNWASGDGATPTATAGTDYVAGSGTVGWAANDNSLTKTFTVNVIGDTVDEPNEFFNVTLTGVSGGTATYSKPVGVGTIKDDDRNGSFSCQSTGVRLLGISLITANAGYSPCADTTGTLLGLPLNLLVSLNANVVYSTTDATPNNPALTAPAIGDSGAGDSKVAAINIGIGGHTITADAVTTHAAATCTSAGVPTLSGNTVLVNLKIDGKAAPITANASVVIPGIAAIYINKTITTGTDVTQRAIWVQGLGLLSAVEVVVGEAKAGYTGNPCTA